MNIEQIAGHFLVHPGTVRGWVRRGLPVEEVGKRGVGYEIDLPSAIDWHRRNILRNLTEDEVWEGFDFSQEGIRKS
jgi:hypothetical protein